MELSGVNKPFGIELTDCRPINAVPRPKGLGLGADRSNSLQTSASAGGQGPEGRDGEKLVMNKGTHCVVKAGKHEGLYGQVCITMQIKYK